VEGRHVVPWRLFGLRGRGDIVLPQARSSDPVARRYHHRGRPDRAVSRAARQLHQQRAVGPAGGRQRALGDGVSQWRTAGAASQPTLRGGDRGNRAVCDSGRDDSPRRLEAAGPDPRQLHRDLRYCAYHRRVLPRARPAAWVFVGRADHGYAAVGADDHCRSGHYCDGMAPQGTEPRRRQAVNEYSPPHSELKKLIKSSGPMPVWRYMELCLTHPKHGYYVSRDPLGREGDFTTAPEVSQMFGELLGLWAASVWKAIGSPSLLRLIELGPGRGTMMADALRALRVLPPLYQALSVHLVEINPMLREKQKAALSGVRVIAWHNSIDEVPDGPAVILANEYFDVLPIHQVVKRETGWHERVVEIEGNGKLEFSAAAGPMPRLDVLLPPLGRAAPVGAVFEWRPDAEIMKIASRVRDQDGAALIVDYGHLRSDAGDTFQAIARHSFTDPLKNPGQADVTAHVDFQALVRAAEDLGARVHGPVPQGEFLKRLGIETRAVTLMAKTTPEVSEDISGALKRLTGGGRGGMGSMFKVLAVPEPHITDLAGFADDDLKAESR